MLISALVLAILYFALMELMLIDATRALTEAQRFRARIVAATLAENGVELASARMITQQAQVAHSQNQQGTMSGELTKSNPKFTLTGFGSATGITPATATVEIDGHVGDDGYNLYIDYSYHSQ